MRLRIDLAYDGGGFHGWAKQPGLRTVQGEMETALHRILGVPDNDEREPLRLVVAGRTDTGVHASHQVCHLDLRSETLSCCSLSFGALGARIQVSLNPPPCEELTIISPGFEE